MRTRGLPSSSTRRTQMKRWKAQVAQVVDLQVGLGARPKILRHGGGVRNVRPFKDTTLLRQPLNDEINGDCR